MALGVVVVLVSIGIVVGLNTSSNNEEKTLKMVHIILRHGSRTPADTYPTDPHINDSLYPVGWGQLTNKGKMEVYEIGRFLRNRYQNFLGDYYSPDEYYAQSTDVDRTKASSLLLNAGLWPPKTIQVWGNLDWQPIPVYAEPLNQDMLLLVRKPCAAYHIERDLVIASQEIQQLLSDYQPLFDSLTEYTGNTVEDFDDVQDVFSTLKAEEEFNLTLPEWTKEFYPDQMLEPTIFSFILNAWNDKMNRLKGGLLLKKIINDWETKLNGTLAQQSKKAFSYVGHDSTIVNFMRTLKVWDSQYPDYGITILLEFSEDITGVHGVEVFLRNSTLVPPYKLTVPGCESFCPLTQLVELTRDVVPDDWEEECGDDDSYDVPEPGGP